MSNKEKTWRPGHVYHNGIRTGIQLTGNKALLWDGGRRVAEANWNGKPWDFWYNLKFVELFPQVTHWWFQSAWTHQVRVSQPQGSDVQGIYGYIQFIDEESHGNIWYYDDNTYSVPFPPFEAQPGNLPLQISLCRLVDAVRRGQLPANEWYTVTSLVGRDELEQVFPQEWSESWRPQLVPAHNMRLSFCRLLGVPEN